jgi:ABC-2 type transport system ATP-binding protein
MNAISARGLHKSYGDKVVLDGIDLDVQAGSVFALLGPNGAGKTTIVNILSTLITPDAGNATVAGADLAENPDGVRGAIGVTGQFSAVDDLLNGEENLMLMADLQHLPRRTGRATAAELLARFELTDAAKKIPTTYSGGMRRKLDLAMTLVGDPKVIFLDEPTTGLDPRSRQTMWDIVRNLAASGVTIFLTTQYLDEADHLADRIAVLDHGRIIAEGTPAELKRQVPGGHVKLTFADAEALRRAAADLAASTVDKEALTLQVPTDGSVASVRSLLDRLDGVALDGIALHTPDLDDVFFTLTGRQTETQALT